MARTGRKIDNSDIELKAQMRLRNLPKKAAVLDLFCGNGEIYQAVYKDKAALYRGVDREKVHDPGLCTLADNIAYLQKTDINQYNVFDLDDYGTPWKQLYIILRKLTRQYVTIFITDGLVMHQNVDNKITKFVSATERLRRDISIPGLNRWYVDIFATMLLDLEERYNWKITKAEYCHNQRHTVYYWALKLRKQGKGKKANERKTKESKDIINR